MKQKRMHGFFKKDMPAIQRLGEGLDAADAVVIGAGAGLSTSAGFTYDGERFQKYFSDFGEKYGFRDMYTGGFFIPRGIMACSSAVNPAVRKPLEMKRQSVR